MNLGLTRPLLHRRNSFADPFNGPFHKAGLGAVSVAIRGFADRVFIFQSDQSQAAGFGAEDQSAVVEYLAGNDA